MTAGSTMSNAAVMVMAYGGPDCLDAVGAFMCELTGREPAGEMLSRIQSRYSAIGGKSPLPQIAEQFAEALSEHLSDDGLDVAVVVGFRYTPPKIGDVMRDLYERGVRRVVAVSLSPFESKSTNTAYLGAARAALAELPGMTLEPTPPFSSLSEFSVLHAEQLTQALSRVEADSDEVLTVFTAHSLPVSDLETPELYASGLREISAVIARSQGFEEGSDFFTSERLPGLASFGVPDSRHSWILAYQSKGQRPGEWLGPDISEVMETAAERGFKAIVVSPIGFATEHMETLYDLDIVEAQRAERLDMGFERGTAPNDDARLVAAVAKTVRDVLTSGT